MAKNTFNSIRIENEEHGCRMEKKLCKQMQCSELMSRVNGFCRKFSPVTLVCARERTQQKKICLLKKEVTHTRSDAGKREKERWALTLQYKVCQFPIQPMQCHNWMKWMCIWCRRHKHQKLFNAVHQHTDSQQQSFSTQSALSISLYLAGSLALCHL